MKKLDTVNVLVNLLALACLWVGLILLMFAAHVAASAWLGPSYAGIPDALTHALSAFGGAMSVILPDLVKRRTASEDSEGGEK